MNINNGDCLEMINDDLKDAFTFPFDQIKTEPDDQQHEEIKIENFNQAFIKYEFEIEDCKTESGQNNEDCEEKQTIEENEIKSLDLRSVDNSTKTKQRKEKLFRCKVCNYIASGVRGIKTHVNKNHTQELTLVSKQKLSTSSSSAYNDQNQFNCEYCNYVATQPEDLKKHVSTLHAYVILYKCYYNKCSYETTMFSSFMEHAKSTHRKKPSVHSCRLCKFTSTSKADLKTHVDNVRTKEDLIKCVFCSFSDVKSANVRQHIRKEHQKEKLYGCRSCTFASLRFDELQKHVCAVHKCKACNYTSTKLSLIKLHTKTKHPLIVD